MSIHTPEQRWLRLFFVIVMTGISLLCLTNLIVDPFDIFGVGILPRPRLDNLRSIKIRYLREHHDLYDSYIFGSSRIGILDPVWLERYLPERRFYNMFVPGSSPYDQVRHLRYFLRQGYTVKRIFLQYDIEPEYAPPPDMLFMRLHPLVTGENPVVAKARYLVLFSRDALEAKLRYNFDPPSVVYYPASGHMIDLEKERWIEAHPEEHLAREGTFHERVTREPVFPGWVLQQKLDGLSEFVALCRRHDIVLDVAVTPHNQIYLDRQNRQGYLYELRRLAEITGGYWDFSGYNSVTTNNLNYFESSHYRPQVAFWLLARIYEQEPQSVPADFGRYVTPANLAGYLARRAAELDRRDQMLREQRDQGSVP